LITPQLNLDASTIRAPLRVAGTWSQFLSQSAAWQEVIFEIDAGYADRQWPPSAGTVAAPQAKVAPVNSPDDRWPIPPEPKSRRRAQHTAWRIMKRAFEAKGGVPRSWSMKKIAEVLDRKRSGGDEPITEDTVTRLLQGD
jgi:hypothetical protein